MDLHLFEGQQKKMLGVLRQIEKQPISLATLRQKLPRHTKVLQYDNLPEKGSLDRVFGKAKCLVIFYTMHDPHNRPIGHFSSILRHGRKKYEYFSSYGYTPEQEIAKTHSSGKLLRLLGKNYIRSNAKLQDKVHSNTCARWAAVRCFLHEVPLQVFIKHFTEKVTLKTPDDIVSLSTLFLFDK
jgi:hypothetical protein